MIGISWPEIFVVAMLFAVIILGTRKKHADKTTPNVNLLFARHHPLNFLFLHFFMWFGVLMVSSDIKRLFDPDEKMFHPSVYYGGAALYALIAFVVCRLKFDHQQRAAAEQGAGADAASPGPRRSA